jgi:hypothetical protein
MNNRTCASYFHNTSHVLVFSVVLLLIILTVANADIIFKTQDCKKGILTIT